jgi:hypothetical protein
MAIAALVDDSDPRIAEAHYWPDGIPVRRVGLDPLELADALGALVETRPEALVLQGDDRFAGRVAAAYHRHLRAHLAQPPFYPLAVGDHHLLAEHLDVPKAPARASMRLRKQLRRGRADRVRLHTVRVSLSSEPAALHAFNVGLGQIYDLLASRQRGRREALATLGTSLLRELRAGLAEDATPDASRPLRDARIVVDDDPVSEPPGFVIVSSLSRTWLRVEMGDEARPLLRLGDDLGDLLRGILEPSGLLARAFPDARGSEPFERILVDRGGGLLVDGELIAGERPASIEISSGPAVTFLRP